MRDKESRSYGYVPPSKKGNSERYPRKEKKQLKKNVRVTHERRESRVDSSATYPKRRSSLKNLSPVLKILWFFVLGVSTLLKNITGMANKSSIPFRVLLMKSVIVFSMFLVFFGSVYILWISKDLPDPDKLTDRQIDQSTKIYDRTGEHLLYEIFAEKRRTLVDLEDIPEDVIHGVVATEDTKFYEHKGIRPLSILRAFIVGVISDKRIAGTSTLTQQLVKNAILTNERSINRKIKEAVLSVRLEQKYSKDQILKIYFNEIPYGGTNYGIEAASQNYFGKSVSEVTLDEAAVLAGLPKAPSSYLRDMDALKNRRDFVLRRMYEEGYITEAEKIDAQAQPVHIKERFENIKAPHFVLYVKDLLIEEYGENLVNTGGLKVITTLDYEKQEAAENAVKEVGKDVLAAAGADNASLVAIDPRTGDILAMVGSYDFFDDEISGKFNVATLGKRQPGSSFKPIVFAAAFEKGYTPQTVLFDVETDFSTNGSSYIPKNYNLKELGPVTMRKALQGSLNIPAVKALYLVGEKEGISFSERLGYSTLSEGDFGLSLVLGGGEVKLIDHVFAYGVFANQGIRQEPVSVLRVEDSSGEILDEHKLKKGDKVLSEDVANTLSNVLIDDEARAYAFGTGGILTLKDRPVAAKTGTTNGYVDAWTVGYTPSLVAGVWAGNTNNKAMKSGFGGSKVAAPIWNAFMKEALKDTAPESFSPMPTQVTDKPVLNGNDVGSVVVKINKLTGRRASSSTPPHLIVERSFIQPHSILHYVDKDDPQGEEPKNPQSDPQYASWEQGIQDWITKMKEENPNWEVSFEEPPTEVDDEYSLELMPSLEIVYPKDGEIYTSRQIYTDIRATAPRGITQVIYKIDDAPIDVVREHPFNLDTFARTLTPGSHTLTVIAEDDIGNRNIQEVTFTLSAGEVEPSVYLTNPMSTISANEFPKTILLSHFKKEEIASVRLYVSKASGTEQKEVGTFSGNVDLFDNQIVFSWKENPGAGDWTFMADITVKSGNVFTQKLANISIE